MKLDKRDFNIHTSTHGQTPPLVYTPAMWDENGDVLSYECVVINALTKEKSYHKLDKEKVKEVHALAFFKTDFSGIDEREQIEKDDTKI